jgi:hypothetical protein
LALIEQSQTVLLVSRAQKFQITNPNYTAMTLAQDVNKKVSLVDKLLPLLIILAIIIGIVISVYAPNAQSSFGGVTVVGVSVPLGFPCRWQWV